MNVLGVMERILVKMELLTMSTTYSSTVGVSIATMVTLTICEFKLLKTRKEDCE